MWAQLDERLAKMFHACNLPFIIADHPVFRQTIEMLRRGYQPPNRKDIGGPLLDKTHEKLTTSMKTQPQGKEVVMMQDGWSDIQTWVELINNANALIMHSFFPVVQDGDKFIRFCITLMLIHCITLVKIHCITCVTLNYCLHCFQTAFVYQV